MSASLLADRYAHALGQAIGEPKELEKATNTLAAFTSLYQDDATFRYAIGNPVLAAHDRVRLADSALVGFEAPEIVTRFVHLLIERNRIGLLPDIARHVENHAAEWLNRIVVTVVTATPPSEDVSQRIVASLERFSGKTVQMKTRIDPDIIGGLVVYMWGVSFDFSLRTRLEKLRAKLLTEVDLTYES